MPPKLVTETNQSSVWRPLKTVKSWPLAVCDSQTVQKSDLVLNDLVRRKYIGESYFAKYNPGHRWHYLSEQGNDEVTVLKIYDSDKTVDANCKSGSDGYLFTY